MAAPKVCGPEGISKWIAFHCPSFRKNSRKANAGSQLAWANFPDRAGESTARRLLIHSTPRGSLKDRQGDVTLDCVQISTFCAHFGTIAMSSYWKIRPGKNSYEAHGHVCAAIVDGRQRHMRRAIDHIRPKKDSMTVPETRPMTHSRENHVCWKVQAKHGVVLKCSFEEANLVIAASVTRKIFSHMNHLATPINLWVPSQFPRSCAHFDPYSHRKVHNSYTGF
jgi:hypothetical protein